MARINRPTQRKIEPLFDIDSNEIPPFLNRPLTDLERSVVRQWVAYYNKRLAIDPWTTPVKCAPQFRKFLNRKNYGPFKITGRKGHPELLFQNLYTHVPAMAFASALARIVGTSFDLTPKERDLAFIEIVEIHKQKHGENAWPRRADIDQYAMRKIFLPRTGIYAQPTDVLLYKNKGCSTGSVGELYRKHFSDEISKETIAKLCRGEIATTQEIVANSKKVYKWMRANNPHFDSTIMPTRVEISAYARLKDGLPWSKYSSWLYVRGGAAGDEVGVERTLEWLHKQCGVEKSTNRNGGKIHRMPAGFWTDDVIRERFEHAWKFLRPDDFQPENGILRNPPTPNELLEIGKVHTQIKRDHHGKLLDHVCDECGVPPLEVPDPMRIAKYSDKKGMQKLLRDIEDDVCPETGIEFTDGDWRVKSFHDHSIAKGKSPLDVPRAVANYIPTEPRSRSRSF